MKLTRRQLAGAVAGVTRLAAQQTPQPQTAAEELKAAGERLRRTTATLAKFPLPMAAEPAVIFKA